MEKLHKKEKAKKDRPNLSPGPETRAPGSSWTLAKSLAAQPCRQPRRHKLVNKHQDFIFEIISGGFHADAAIPSRNAGSQSSGVPNGTLSPAESLKSRHGSPD